MSNKPVILSSGGRARNTPVERLTTIGPPTLIGHFVACYDLYYALWAKQADNTWKQVTMGVNSTAPTGAPDKYVYRNTTTGFTYIYNKSGNTWSAITDEAVPTFTPDAGGDPGVAGLVPASAAGDAAAKKVLLATGTWANVAFSDVTYTPPEVAANATVATLITALDAAGIISIPA